MFILRRFVLLENVGSLMNKDQRPLADHILEAWFNQFDFLFPLSSFEMSQEARKRDMRINWATVDGHMAGAPVLPLPYGLMQSRLSSMCSLLKLDCSEIWRQRCFLLLQKRGFDFFAVVLTC